MRIYCLILAIAVLGGCGGLDRDEAAQLIRDAHFGPEAGLVLRIRLPPSAVMRHNAVLGDYSNPVGDCAMSAVGWEDVPGSIECVRALATVGAITSCGSARLTDSTAAGPTIAQLQPLPMGCGRERFGADVVLSGRSDLADARYVVFVASFAPTALPTERCQDFLDRSETSLLAAARPYADHHAEWVPMTIKVPGATRFVEVTGITDGANGEKIAEFRWAPVIDRIAPLTEADACSPAPGQRWPSGDPRTSRATLRHFDDGWRVESVDWGD